jgi:hypothetical protein
MEERPIEVSTDHTCVLGTLTRRLADADVADVADAAALAAGALERLLRDGGFDRCCLPHYLRLAPDRGDREIQIPIAERGGIETRVLVWPRGASDRPHPHVDGWTVFIPAKGQLVAIDEVPGEGTTTGPLRVRTAAVLRPEEGIEHRLRNAEDALAVTIHISGPRV